MIGRLLISLCMLSLLGGCGSLPSLSRGAVSPAAGEPAGAEALQNESSLYFDIIGGLIKQDRHGAALAFLDSYAIARKDPEPRYWLLRGDALLGLGRREEAAIAYARLDRTALAAAGWNGRGQVAASMSRWYEAALYFGKAVRGEPTNADFLNNLAFADLRAGRSDLSVVSLRQAQELKPQSELIRNNLIIALTLHGDRAGAAAMLDMIADPAWREKVRAMVQNAVAKAATVQEDRS
jgi:Flp pilus assembly protein TadD